MFWKRSHSWSWTLYTFTVRMPPMVSWTWLLILPSSSYMRRESFCRRDPNSRTRSMVDGINRITTVVNRALSLNIRMTAPTSVNTARASETMPLVRMYWMLPTSLVMRLDMSPAFWSAKYKAGNSSMWAKSSRRSRVIVRRPIRADRTVDRKVPTSCSTNRPARTHSVRWLVSTPVAPPRISTKRPA